MSDLQSITIGKRLKAYFEEQSISQSTIAERLGVSQPAISALLNGKPFGKSTAKKWSEQFGLKPNWLLTGEGDMLKESGNQKLLSEAEEPHLCPFSNSMTDVLNISKEVLEMNKKLLDQQADLIATIRALTENK